jgi:hypothetical protein
MEPKKKYSKPEFHEVQIDRDISLVMMSDPGNGEAPPGEPENAMYSDTQSDDPFASPFE